MIYGGQPIYRSVVQYFTFLTQDTVSTNQELSGTYDATEATVTLVPANDWDATVIMYNLYGRVKLQRDGVTKSCTVSNAIILDNGAVEVTLVTAVPDFTDGTAKFILDTKYTPNQAQYKVIGAYILNVMSDLDVCIKKLSNCGNEYFYTEQQKAVILDLVLWYVLFFRSINNIQTNNGNVVDGLTFISKAKNGASEVEFKEFNDSSAGAGLGSKATLDFLINSAKRKGAHIGCIIDLCDGCALAVKTMFNPDLTSAVFNDPLTCC